MNRFLVVLLLAGGCGAVETPPGQLSISNEAGLDDADMAYVEARLTARYPALIISPDGPLRLRLMDSYGMYGHNVGSAWYDIGYAEVYVNRCICAVEIGNTAVHEVGHLLGLPDLSPGWNCMSAGWLLPACVECF